MSIEIKNLTYIYGDNKKSSIKALDDVSLVFKDKSFTAVVGHTGSGKSTLMQNLNALLVPTFGTVKIDDYTITSKIRKNKNIKEIRKKVGLVFQFPEYQLFEETVLKDVAFGLKNFGYENNKALIKAKEALKAVGIEEKYFNKSPFELSGGQKRRVAIAGILVLNPDYLVLDEPTAGLDREGEKQILSLLKTLNESGKTIILVTHDMEIVSNYCSDVVLLNKGKVEFVGSPNDLFKLDLTNMNLTTPPLYSFIKKINEKGIKFEREILTLDELFDEVLKRKKDD